MSWFSFILVLNSPAIYQAIIYKFYENNATALVQGNLLTVIPKLYEEFLISFDFQRIELPVEVWYNILHFTIGGDNNVYGYRIPSVFIYPEYVFEVCFALNGDFAKCSSKVPSVLGQWMKVEISQFWNCINYVYKIKINDIDTFSEINYQFQSFENVSVYASDPWSPTNGFINNLVIVSGNISSWMSWGSWSTCSAPFGFGVMNRTRVCNTSQTLACCLGSSIEVKECFLKSYADFTKTLWNVSNIVTLNGYVLTMNLQIHSFFKSFLNAYLEFEYFLPPYFYYTAESVLQSFIRSDANRIKYEFNGSIYSFQSLNTSFTANIICSKCSIPGKFILDIPLKISTQVESGNRITFFKTFRNVLDCYRSLKIPVVADEQFLEESYGRGIFWDAEELNIYVCMNQHIASTKEACYFSNDEGESWSVLDVRIGSVLGRHSETKELYAIHRNQKTYMVFCRLYRKWFALTNQQYYDTASRFIDVAMRKSFDDVYDRIYTLGPNQWLGNDEGLFFRKSISDFWLLRLKWSFQ